MDGWFEQCLQCSYRRELKDLADFRRQPVGVLAGRDIDWSAEEGGRDDLS
jgi:hypothetical protein